LSLRFGWLIGGMRETAPAVGNKNEIMRYKNNVLDQLVHLESLVNRVQFEVGRGMDQERISETTELLKEQVEKIRGTISIEPDDFEQQFAPRQ
jgi:hypothetical protein